MASPKISLRGVHRAFGPKKVLQGIELDVAPGESMVVIGGSGTGKSVLLKCILGLMRPDSGSIKIDGEETADLSSRDRARVMRKFGMLFQGGALFDSLRVWENVAFGPIQSDGMAPARAREIAIAKLGAVGLGPEIGDLFPSELSGGMQKRVALARAIAREPEIIFFDEPTTGLHFEDVNTLLSLLNRLVERGNTVLVIEHNVDVLKAADHIIDMGPSGGSGGGRIVAEGTPEEIAAGSSPTAPYL